MNFDNNQINYLLEKLVNKTITEVEHKELFELINKEESKATVLSFMDSYYKNLNSTADAHDFDWETIYAKSKLASSKPAKQSYSNLLKYAAVLACIIGIGIFGYKKLNTNSVPAENVVAKNNADIDPGSNKATLTLSNGEKIDLENLKNGSLNNDNGVTIKKNKEGLIVYTFAKTEKADVDAINTISTPRGGNFQIALPDGSNIWLNSSTTIKFPINFKPTERHVELITGEAYFEVTKNKAQPFYVSANTGLVKVLGTHFNVESIKEQAKVTLIEGSVKITKENSSKILVPGEQGSYNKNSANISSQNVDTEAVIDWKNDLFIFNNTPINDIMASLSNWYDVDIVYTGQIPTQKFTGILSRKNKLSKLIVFLEKAGDLSFDIKDKTIYVKQINKKKI